VVKALKNLSWIPVLAMLALSACGKNSPVVNGGYYPVAPAPYGNNPYYQYPNGNGGSGYTGYNGMPYSGYNNGGGYPYGNYSGPYNSPYGYQFPNSGGSPYYFYPQIPSGYPQSYYPFAPVDNYFRNNPNYGPHYWNTMWNGWKQQATRWGVSPYDFNTFWNDYCPKVWKSGQEYQVYIHLDRTFYYWSQPGVEIPQQSNPQLFWSNYIGIIY